MRWIDMGFPAGLLLIFGGLIALRVRLGEAGSRSLGVILCGAVGLSLYSAWGDGGNLGALNAIAAAAAAAGATLQFATADDPVRPGVRQPLPKTCQYQRPPAHLEAAIIGMGCSWRYVPGCPNLWRISAVICPHKYRDWDGVLISARSTLPAPDRRAEEEKA